MRVGHTKAHPNGIDWGKVAFFDVLRVILAIAATQIAEGIEHRGPGNLHEFVISLVFQIRHVNLQGNQVAKAYHRKGAP